MLSASKNRVQEGTAVPRTPIHPQNFLTLFVTFEKDGGGNEHLAGQGDRLEIILRAASRSSEVQTLTSNSREPRDVLTLWADTEISYMSLGLD